MTVLTIVIICFKQLTKHYPEILTPDNIWIIGITQNPSTHEYYLIFYNEIHAILDRIIQQGYYGLKFMEYTNFYEIREIGSGAYETVYTASCNNIEEECVVLRSFKNFDQMPELLISEVSNL